MAGPRAVVWKAGHFAPQLELGRQERAKLPIEAINHARSLRFPYRGRNQAADQYGEDQQLGSCHICVDHKVKARGA